MSDTRKTTKPNVPNLRFPGFSGEWERVTIGQICNIVGGGTPDTNIKEYWNGGIQWFTPSEVGKEKYVSDSIRTISIDGLKNSSAKLLPPYSILLSSRATVGECSINLRECCTNQGFQSAVPKVDITSTEFLYYRLLTHKREFIKKACGSTFLEISAKQISKLNTFIPARSEQEKIADLLSLIDERISIQNKVIEKYESLIKALCQILITSPNGTVCHIGDVLKIGSGKDHKHLNIGTIPVFGTGGYMLSVNDWLYEGESVCIGRKGTIDNPFFVDGKFWTVDTLFYTYDFNGVLPKFCYYLFRTINWLQYNEASGVPSLSKSTIERIQIRIPCMDEQAKAVQVLDGVEMEITCRRKLLNLYKSIKQYLISQLFI